MSAPKTAEEPVEVSVQLERAPEIGWWLVRLETQGGQVVRRMRIHGPDLKSVCLKKALFLLGESS